jgi:hypothetical protein
MPITTNVVSTNLVHDEVYLIQHYVIKVVSDLWQVGVFSGYSGFIHQWKWPPRNNWNIVESGIKHHNPNLNLSIFMWFVTTDNCKRKVIA